MSGPPPICDAACQKIILNSGNIVALVDVTRRRLKSSDLPSGVGTCDEVSAICDAADEEVAKLKGIRPGELSAEEKAATIARLNHHENEVCRAQKLFLKAVGYQGPTGKMLK